MTVEPTCSPAHAPDYAPHRIAVAAADTLTNFVDAKSGMNMRGYKKAHIQVIPEATCQPAVAVYWWSEAASKFVREFTAITRASLGAGVAYEFTVDCLDRILLVLVTAVVAETVSIYVAGADDDVQT